MKKHKSILLPILKNKTGIIIFTILSAVLYSVSGVIATLQISSAMDNLAGKGNVNYAGLGINLRNLIIIYIVSAISSWLIAALSNRIAFSTARDIRHLILEKLGRLPLAYYDGTPHGDIISRFTNDLDSISNALSLSLASVFSGLATVVTVLIVMFKISTKITFVIILMTPLTFLAAKIVTSASQNTFRKQQEIVGEMSGYISEMVGNQKVIKAFGYESESVAEFEHINSELNKTGKKAHFASAMVNPSTRVVDHVSYILVGVVGGFIALSNGLTIGNISAFLMFSSQFAKPFNEISGIMSDIQTGFAAMQRVRLILNEKEEIPDDINAKVLEKPKGLVEFKNVDFSYDKKRPLIQDFSLKTNSSDLIAIVGPTGAGKTTIVNLLMRFYEIDNGAIMIDGENIVRITKDSLRKSFGMVLQETWLFNGTIKENIAYGCPDATDEEIKQAGRMSYADNFISRLPGGYDTVIAEDGGNLSGGQKQLLTIARVMLTNPSMLILDEATSSIDTLTEKRVQKAFLNLMSGRTSFVIAHRLSTIVKADMILVLDKGQVVETGTHNELLNKKGFYYQLYESQFQ